MNVVLTRIKHICFLSLLITVANAKGNLSIHNDLYNVYKVNSNSINLNCINDIIQDNKGYILIATQQGLSVFNGYNVREIDVSGITAKRRFSSFRVIKNQLFVSTASNFLAINELSVSNSIEKIPLKGTYVAYSGFSNDTVYTDQSLGELFSSSNYTRNSLVIGKVINNENFILYRKYGFDWYHNNIKRKSIKLKTLIHDEQYSNLHFSSLSRQKATLRKFGNYYSYKDEYFQVNCRFIVYKNTSNNTITIYDIKNNLNSYTLSLNGNFKLLQTNDSTNFYLYSYKGLYTLDIKRKILQKIANFDLNIGDLFKVVKINDEVLYIASQSNGLYRLNKKCLYNFYDSTLTDNSHNKLFYVNDSTLFSSSKEFFLTIGSDGLIKKRLPYRGSHILSLISDSSGKEWCLIKKDNQLALSWENKRLKQSKLVFNTKKVNHRWDAFISSLFQGRDSVVWLTHFDDIYYVKNNIIQHYVTTYGNKRDPIYSICDFSKKELLIAKEDGLYIINKLTRKISKPSFLDNIEVRNLKLLDSVCFIFTYGNGIYCYNGTRFFKCPLDRNKALLFAHTVIKDKLNRYWVSTNNGLLLIDRPTEFLAPMNVSYYYNEWGASSNEYNTGNSYSSIQFSNGLCALPNMGGIVLFYPDSIRTIDHKIHVDLWQLLENNIRINYTSNKGINFSNKAKQISFDISFPYYGNHDNLQLMYAIAEVNAKDTIWNTYQYGRINTSAMKYGSYVLLFKYYSFLKRSFIPANFYTFTIAPKWYQKKSTYFLLFAVFICSLYIFYHQRVNKLKRNAKELHDIINKATQKLEETNGELYDTVEIKNQLIAIFSHDILGSLNSMIMALEIVKMQNSNAIDSHNNDFINHLISTGKHFTTYAEDALSTAILIGQKNNVLETEKIYIKTLIQQCWMKLDFSSFNRNAKLDLCDYDGYIISNKRVIEIALYNILNNSIKFNFGVTISVTIVDQHDKLLIQIIDNGVGFPAKVLKDYSEKDKNNIKQLTDNHPEAGKGIGLLIISQLLEKVNIRLVLSNNETGGAKVTMIVEKASG